MESIHKVEVDVLYKFRVSLTVYQGVEGGVTSSGIDGDELNASASSSSSSLSSSKTSSSSSTIVSNPCSSCPIWKAPSPEAFLACRSNVSREESQDEHKSEWVG
jgi:hypothetical protein